MSQRLQKVLARAGVASRRKAEDLITQGRVKVNGHRAVLGMKVGPEDMVQVDDQTIDQKTHIVSYMLNKPVGVISTAADELGRKTVFDLVPKVAGLHTVGRLDKDSEGLLLLSTDGDLSLKLTHPRYQHEKEYRVWCKQGSLSAGELASLEQGIDLEDGVARAVVAKRAEGGCKLVMTEGRKRIVRRMIAAVGFTVIRLQRTRIGKLNLGDLALGHYRQLEDRDIEKVMSN